eukprot:9130160-Pyramimonas_sp.AAC.1
MALRSNGKPSQLFGRAYMEVIYQDFKVHRLQELEREDKADTTKDKLRQFWEGFGDEVSSADSLIWLEDFVGALQERHNKRLLEARERAQKQQHLRLVLQRAVRLSAHHTVVTRPCTRPHSSHATHSNATANGESARGAVMDDDVRTLSVSGRYIPQGVPLRKDIQVRISIHDLTTMVLVDHVGCGVVAVRSAPGRGSIHAQRGSISCSEI